MRPVVVVSSMVPVVVSSMVPEDDELPSTRPESPVLDEPSVVPPALALALADALIPVVRTPVVGSSGAVVDPSLAGGPLLSNGLTTSEPQAEPNRVKQTKAKLARTITKPRSQAP